MVVFGGNWRRRNNVEEVHGAIVLSYIDSCSCITGACGSRLGFFLLSLRLSSFLNIFS